MKRIAAVLTVIALVPALAINALAAGNTSAKFDWHVSDAFIQTAAGPNQTGAVAKASDSGVFTAHSVRVSGMGTMNTAGMTATGGGTFVHTDAGGQVVAFGTWTATSLTSFTLYGCDTGPFPADFCGGVAVMAAHVVATTTNPACGHRSPLQEPFVFVRHWRTSAVTPSLSLVVASRGSAPATVFRQSVQTAYADPPMLLTHR